MMERRDMPTSEFTYVGGRYWIDRAGNPWRKKKDNATWTMVANPNESTNAIRRCRLTHELRVLKDKLRGSRRRGRRTPLRSIA